ncbi:hypothetical protein ACFL1B_03820 [Nanoarchaeota archaeon]
MELKKIGVWSLAKIQCIIMAVFGLIMGIIQFMALITSNTATGVSEDLYVYPWLPIVVMPIFYAILGFLIGALGAWLYNILAKKIGGIQLELKK